MAIPGFVRTPLVALRDELHRRLPPRRRARAQARLERLAPRRVLVLCLGTICRSPFAERLLARHADVEVESAGFIKPGRPPPHEALATAQAYGVDHADHRSQEVTAEMLATADAVFVFDREHLGLLTRRPDAPLDRVFWVGDFDPEWAGKRAIIDPWGRGDEMFVSVFRRIDRCVEEVGAVVRGR